MNIVVLNGSPKSEKYSVTMTYIHYIQNMFPQHHISILNVGQQLIGMKIHDKGFTKIIDAIKSADGIIWAFPIYTMLIPAPLKRFIELIWEKEVQMIFQHKYSAVLSTSMKFYDHTAHNYIHAIIDDLNMKYVGFYSAIMDDLLREEKRKQLILFIQNFIYSFEHKLPVTTRYAPLIKNNFEYKSGEISHKICAEGQKVTILTDSTDPESNISKMIDHFKNSFADDSDIEIINLHDINIKGGCLGCIQCGFENKCVYKDDFIEFFNSKIRAKKIMIYAMEITDRYFSSKWKQFWDRTFFNGHRPAMFDTQMGFLISGPLRQIENLRQLIATQVECGHANLVDIITDEDADSRNIDILIENMAAKTIRFQQLNYRAPTTFLEVGGFKVFRDLIYGLGKMTFPSDYKFFKKNGMFDFPNKDRKTMALSNFMTVALKSEKFRKKFQSELKDLMIAQSNKFLENFDMENEMRILSEVHS